MGASKAHSQVRAERRAFVREGLRAGKLRSTVIEETCAEFGVSPSTAAADVSAVRKESPTRIKHQVQAIIGGEEPVGPPVEFDGPLMNRIQKPPEGTDALEANPWFHKSLAYLGYDALHDPTTSPSEKRKEFLAIARAASAITPISMIHDAKKRITGHYDQMKSQEKESELEDYDEGETGFMTRPSK